MDFIESFLRHFDAASVNIFILALLSLTLLTALYLKKANRAVEFVQYTPTLLTTLGILGTFFGIVLGLLDFDQNNIEDSIPLLLAGLKTAFITSLAGMFSSLFFKILSTTPLFRPSIIEGEVVTASPELILAALRTQVDETKALRNAVVGNEESTLFGQVKILRSDINDNAKRFHMAFDENQERQNQQFSEFSDKLWLKLQDFADTLSKSATEQVIEALKSVIQDFNNNLTEQFGDNFKELNEAVKELVTWQENYKTQLNQMLEQYEQGVQAITDTEASLANISEKSKVIPETMDDLKQVLTVNQHQLKELESHLESFKDMRDRAIEAVPEIRRQVEETVSDISAAVDTANSHYKKLLSDSDEFIQKHSKTSEELLDKFANSTQQNIEKVGHKLTESADKIGKDIEIAGNVFTDNTARTNESIENMSQYLQSRTEVIAQQLEDMVTDLNNQVREMVERMADDFKAINSTMGEANSNLVNDTKNVRNQVVVAIEGMQDQLKDVIEQVASEHNTLADNTFRSLEQQIAKQVAQTGEVVEKQIGVLDQAMQEEINNAFRDMGTQLAKVTTRFTEDYRLLTEQMHQVVNRASTF